MVKKIALEEHFLCPGFEDYWTATVGDVDPAIIGRVTARLNDFGGERLEIMDKAGILRSVLGLSGPGVQAERDLATALRKAREANDFLAREVQKRPDRYSGFAHLAMQDPRAAADELQRCVGDLKFLGAMINGHTNGRYLDDRVYDVFWERVEALGVPIYLHPTDPLTPYATLDPCRALKRATWEWTLETGTHALRLVFGGVFQRYPGATLVLGHMGETLPYLLWRFDSRAKLYGIKLGKEPSEYIRNNIAVTVSGVFSADPMICAVSALGRDRVMFSADYPFESTEEASQFMDTAAIDEGLRADIAYNNAAKLLKLGQ